MPGRIGEERRRRRRPCAAATACGGWPFARDALQERSLPCERVFLASRLAKGQTRHPHPFFSTLLKAGDPRVPPALEAYAGERRTGRTPHGSSVCVESAPVTGARESARRDRRHAATHVRAGERKRDGRVDRTRHEEITDSRTSCGHGSSDDLRVEHGLPRDGRRPAQGTVEEKSRHSRKRPSAPAPEVVQEIAPGRDPRKRSGGAIRPAADRTSGELVHKAQNPKENPTSYSHWFILSLICCCPGASRALEPVTLEEKARTTVM